MDALKMNCTTTEEIYALPDGQRAELIDGVIYNMAPPKRIHQKMISRLTQTIANYIDGKGRSCEVYPAPFAVFLNADNKTYVEPDISVICDKSKLDELGCNGAPDWIIEIVSESSRKMDYMVKLIKYNSAGVKEYWIVDPDRNRILIYDFAHDTLAEYTFSDTVRVGIYEDLEIDFSKLDLSTDGK